MERYRLEHPISSSPSPSWVREVSKRAGYSDEESEARLAKRRERLDAAARRTELDWGDERYQQPVPCVERGVLGGPR